MPQRLSGETREVERHLLRNLRKSACQTGVDRDLPWDELAVSQHHGLPTRLLDLSWLED
ncbi:MAG: FRG domain-containing protein, partial [Deinococcota bacterium]